MERRFNMAEPPNGFFSLIVIGAVVHLIYLASMFEIYFTSPLVHGMTPHSSKHTAPARRLVLVVLDGLRSERLYELSDRHTTNAPFLRDIIQTRGAWGVSHTRVPTESRPGHVAIIGGFYEDVSAVTKGWQENPVDFDSVLNQSRFTWSWGSPDIVTIFDRGHRGNIFSHFYSPQDVDLVSNITQQDNWVFNKFKNFLEDAKKNETLMTMLHKDKIVFFLHLLALDTLGHTFRPVSKEIEEHLRAVDSRLKECVQLLEQFYDGDGKTAFVITSDHGMTDWGSHGAGHLHETEVPIVTWGAGLRGPVSYQNQDKESVLWGLEAIKRTDVQQADLAPLMASLLGINYPLNSVGVLPVDFLKNTEEYKAENLFVNAQQILEQYLVKENFRRETSLMFRPFQELPASRRLGMIRDIKQNIQSSQYSVSSALSLQLIKLSLKGLSYYHNYDRTLLTVIVTLGFLGWILYVIIQLLRKTAQKSKSFSPLKNPGNTSKILFVSLGVVIGILLLWQRAPLSYYVYTSIPLLFWGYNFSKLEIVISGVQVVLKSTHVAPSILAVLMGVVFLESLVMSFFHRELLSVDLLVMASWSLTAKLRPAWKVAWVTTCSLLALFPLFPVVGHEPSYVLVIAAGMLGFLSLVAVYYSMHSSIKEQSTRSKFVMGLQLILILAASLIVHSTTSSIARKNGLPLFNQFTSWTILALAFILPTLSSKTLVFRLLSSLCGLFSAYLLLSISYEGLFFLLLTTVLVLWLFIEFKLSDHLGFDIFDFYMVTENIPSLDATHKSDPNLGQKNLTLHDVRRASFFLFFLIMGFFGTGNIASLNSFSPTSVYCFITTFSPFTMGGLLLFKVIMPFIAVTYTLDSILLVLQVPVHDFFLVFLVMSDVMAIHFFYWVKDFGSWLDIGTSISHFVIMISCIVFVLVIFGLIRLLNGLPTMVQARKKYL